MHAEVKIGDSFVMMGEPTGQLGPMTSSIYLYVEDCDKVYERAVEAGAVSVMKPSDMLTGERYGGVKDPAGNIWWVATHIEDVSQEEAARRLKAFFQRNSDLPISRAKNKTRKACSTRTIPFLSDITNASRFQ